MQKSIAVLIFAFIQISLYSQYEIVKYSFSDSYKTDENYVRLLKERSLLIEEVISFRELILQSSVLLPQEKRYALEMVEIFLTDPEELVNIMMNVREGSSWYKLRPKDEVDQLVQTYMSVHFYANLIKESYQDIESNIFIQNMKGNIEDTKRIIKSLGLHNEKRRMSIFLRNQTNNIEIDELLNNKDIYFTTYSYSILDKWAWSQQFYAFIELSKRNNEYYTLVSKVSISELKEKFDYIIERIP